VRPQIHPHGELNSPPQPENGWLLVFIAALIVIAAIGGLQ